MNCRNGVLEVLEEMGIFLEITEESIPLQEYIVESIQFITLVVKLEEKFNFVFPDEYLIYESISTLDVLCQIIEEVLKK